MEEQQQGQRVGKSGAAVEKVRIGGSIGRDTSGGRCIMIRDVEGARRKWLLIGREGSGGTNRTRVTPARRKIERGKVVAVKMGWDVDLGLRDREEREREQEREDGYRSEGGGGAIWKVAVLWNVLDA